MLLLIYFVNRLRLLVGAGRLYLENEAVTGNATNIEIDELANLWVFTEVFEEVF